MDKGLRTATAPIPPPRKAAARAALVDMKEPAMSILSECFRQFGVESVSLIGNAAERFAKEKFEACVVNLTPAAEAVMEPARTSASNSRLVLYGLGGSAQEAMKFSKYGINAIFNEPLERPAALKLVRATQMLVLHEFRRYVRIPLQTQVSVVAGQNRHFDATSQELSSGGMSLTTSDEVPPGTPVEVSFALLTLPRIWIRGAVTWTKPAAKT